MGTSDVKGMSLRCVSTCECGRQLPAGTRAGWDEVRQVVVCAQCLDGERDVAEYLESKLSDSALFLYNRRLGDARHGDEIDILAVVPSGVFIIDPKKYVGRNVRATPAYDAFIIDGQPRPHLSERMSGQLLIVSAAVGSGPVPDAPVGAAYCFVRAHLPWRRIHVHSVPVMTPRSVAKLLNAPGPLEPDECLKVLEHLDAVLPPA